LESEDLLVRWQETGEQACSLARSMSIFGDRWTLLIIRQVFMRIRKYSDIQSSLGISRHRLSDRLNRLVSEGVFYKEAYDKAGTRFEYKLTEKGVALYPVIITIIQWGDRWQADADGPPVVYQHKTCGHVIQPEVCCIQCNEVLTAKNTAAIPGPGLLKKVERGELNDKDLTPNNKVG
jgi:DNA-binding HxlR family transcriptional regulator